MARPHYGPVEVARATSSSERPQVLAQLAKDISELIRSARSNGDRRPEATPKLSVQAVQRAEPITRLEVLSQRTFQEKIPDYEEDVQQAYEEPPTLYDEAFNVPTTEAQASPSLFRPPSHRSPRPHSPHQVHSLLSNIQNREAALRLKVQQLTEEKALREQRLEDELERLQRSNARLEEELQRERQERPSTPVEVHASVAPSNWHQAEAPPELWRHRDAEAPPELWRHRDTEEANDVIDTAPRWHDLRFDLQQQLSEIRAEVTRCAELLHEPQRSVPSAEVLDIRQQLSALSEEVLQTSKALRGAKGEESELHEVKAQLDMLQGQVSSALTALIAGPVVKQESPPAPRDLELEKLKAEVESLRSQIGQVSRGPSPSIPTFSSTAATWPLRGPSSGQVSPVTFQPQATAELTTELQDQIEALRAEVGQLAQSQALTPQVTSPPLLIQPPPPRPKFAPEVASLHGRLTAIRAEVANVLQEQQLPDEDPSSHARQAHLRALLSELQDVRSSAAELAVAAGRTTPSRSAWETGAWHQSQLTPTLAEVSMPSRPGLQRLDASSGFRPSNWPPGMREVPYFQPMIGLASPLLVCPHLASDFAAVANGPSDLEASWYNTVGGDASSATFAERESTLDSGFPSFQPDSTSLQPPSSLLQEPVSAVHSAASSSSRHQPIPIHGSRPSSASRLTPSTPHFTPSIGPAWEASLGRHGQLSPMASSFAEAGFGTAAAGGFRIAETAESIDRPPQGLMRRPSRSKLHEVMPSEPTSVPSRHSHVR